MPSRLHDKLEKFAEDTLLNEGFTNIYREYPILITLENNETKRFVVDVVGIKENKKIAIECITVAYSKLQLLKKAFDEVRHITVDDYIEYLETRIRELEPKKQETKTVIRTTIKPINITQRTGNPKIHKITNATKLMKISEQKIIPYDELQTTLKKDGEVFLESPLGAPLKRATILYAAKKLSTIMGRKVHTKRGHFKIEVEGYFFALAEPNKS